MGCNRDLRSNKTRGMFHYLTKRLPTKANNGQVGGFLITMNWKDHIVRVNSISPRVAELVLCVTKCYKLKIVQVCASTRSYSDDDINNFYNYVDETLGKPNYYKVVMGEFNAQMLK